MSNDGPMQPETRATEATPQASWATLEGELTSAPRGVGLTIVLAATGLLLVIESARALARWVLALRRPAVVRLTATSIEVRGSTTLLGRVLREHFTIIPRDALMHATREVRYPRLGMYAGLVALTLGSYLGVGLAVDGLRASSPSMLGTGLLIVLFGLLLDFVFATLLPGWRGRSRLVLLPRRGPAVCLADIEPAAADALLAALASAPLARDIARGRGADAVASEPERETAEQTR